MHRIRAVVGCAVVLSGPPAWAETVEVVGRNTNNECFELDQTIAGRWQVERNDDAYRISKSGQVWKLTEIDKGRWAGEQKIPHYAVGLVIRAILNPAKSPPTLTFSTGWNCRWGPPRPKPADDED